jgi:hypothetical protein
VTGETGPNSEPAKEFHYAGVISPPFFDSAIAASWIASRESLSFRIMPLAKKATPILGDVDESFGSGLARFGFGMRRA